MSSKARNRIAQVLLLCLWVIIIIVEFAPQVLSQTCDLPGYMNPIYSSGRFGGDSSRRESRLAKGYSE